jgi:hypothetical protein
LAKKVIQFCIYKNKKIDKNDALTSVQTTFMPDVTYIGGKTVEEN